MIIRDGDWTLFDHDMVTGRTVWHMFDGEKDVFRCDYPVEATLAENKAMRDNAQRAWKGDYHLIASVPLNVLHDEKTGLLEASKQGDDKYFSRWLNDPDNRAWRTKDGRV